jgi:hypothetical protein
VPLSACLPFSSAHNTFSSYLITHVSIFRFHICTHWHSLDTCSTQPPLLSFGRSFLSSFADRLTAVQIALDQVSELKVALSHHKVFLFLRPRHLFRLLLRFFWSVSSVRSGSFTTFPRCLDLCHQAYAICEYWVDSRVLRTKPSPKASLGGATVEDCKFLFWGQESVKLEI